MEQNKDWDQICSLYPAPVSDVFRRIALIAQSESVDNFDLLLNQQDLNWLSSLELAFKKN